jgi:uncharacterized membrane protein YfcA
MMEMTVLMLAGLTATAFVAGFVDSIAGGGGLLTVPALLLAGLPPTFVLGTNKGQSVWGSGWALLRFAHSPLLERRRAAWSFVPGVLAAMVGAWLIADVDQQLLRPIILGLLATVAVFMILYHPPHVHRPPVARAAWVPILLAVVLAFYDGCFGPGTGTFLILAYVLVYHDSLHGASANAKLVNFASNLGALAVFAARGLVLWKLALPMGVAAAAGAFLGAHLTIHVGQRLVRWAVVVVSLALLTRLAWQLLRPG